MIRIRLRDGQAPRLEGGDQLRLSRPFAGELVFQPSDIEVVELKDGEVSVIDGHRTGTTDQVRGIAFTDAETGVVVQLVMDLEAARELGDHLSRGKIIPARL